MINLAAYSITVIPPYTKSINYRAFASYTTLGKNWWLISFLNGAQVTDRLTPNSVKSNTFLAYHHLFASPKSL